VNLPQGEAYQGHSDEHEDRRGHRIRVRIILRQTIEEARQGNFRFQVRMVPGGSNALYTGQEKNRAHGHYLAQPDNEDWSDPLTISSGNSRVIEDHFSVTAAGGDMFTIQARCVEYRHVVSSIPIRVWRRIWVQEVKMTNVGAARDIIVFRNKFQNGHHLAIRQERAVTMTRMANIGDGRLEKEQFLRNTRRAYDGVRSRFRTRERYVVVIAYTDQLAVKQAGFTVIKDPVAAPGFNTSEAMGHFIDVPITDGTERYLWKGIDDAATDEERFQSWFVSAHFVTGSRRIAIPNSQQNCQPVPDPSFTPVRPDACKKVRVNVARLVPRDTTGRIELVVNVVNRFRGGISYGGGNLICVCTRSWWRSETQLAQNAVLIHEMGHKIGMVPDGNPSRTCDLEHTNALFPNQYRRRGHRGSHCCAGVGPPAAGGEYDGSEAPDCVMFGSSRQNVQDFCPHCTRAVNKVDLSDGWGLFSPSGWSLLQFF